jgi:beta-galactosidase
MDDSLARVRGSLDLDWRFCKGDLEKASEVDFDDSKWSIVDIPHDWSISGPIDRDNPSGGLGGYFPTGIGWYRKHFFVPSEYSGKQVTVEFDGVYMNSDVWINGRHLGRHVYGYTGFQYDMSGYLNYGGDNVIAVRVDNSEQPGSRWYTGSGIYRHVWMVSTDRLHVAYCGTQVAWPLIKPEWAVMQVRTTVENSDREAARGTLCVAVVDSKGETVAKTCTTFYVRGGGSEIVYSEAKVPTPHLWSLEDPYMYTLITTITRDGKLVDRYETPVGIRSIRFDCDEGFFLNDKRVKMNGVCLHHDGGCVGAAVPERVWERRLEILKEMGCNAIRTAHNPPAPEFLDLCDRMGFLVMVEAFDEWEIGKWKVYDRPLDVPETAYGYHNYFPEHGLDDLIAMVRRDRNHPCVVIWSIHNEVPDERFPEGVEICKRLVDVCHREDPTRPVTAGNCWIKHEPIGTSTEFLEALDVVGYNYVGRWRERAETYYEGDKRRFPHWKMIGTEDSSISEVRGEYKLTDEIPAYCSNMIDVERLWKFTSTRDYVAGDFMWAGIDYLGEAGWPRNAFCAGPLDTCAFKKDTFYFYQSQWTKKPMVHIFPHWNWEGMEGTIVPVVCYTNCDSVELFLNGKSYRSKSYQFPTPGMSESYDHYSPPRRRCTTGDLHLSWDVPYEPGVLRAVGRIAGEVVCVEEVATAGKPHRLELVADRDRMLPDARDVCHLTVRIVDDRGTVVPYADNRVTFEVEGKGRLIGVDNGDPASHEDYGASSRKAFHGLCLAIVKSTPEPGEVLVKAISPGLVPGVVKIVSKYD